MPPDHPKRRILRLLEEAIRRDIHFIDRHPTTLFQCMWNMCWWYDCREEAGHYMSFEEYRRELEEMKWRTASDDSKELLRPGLAAAEEELPEFGQTALRIQAPWERPEAKIHELLVAWRVAKGEQTPGFRWMRSLRPLMLHLGSGQCAALLGHGKPVNDAVWSPNGTRIACCADD